MNCCFEFSVLLDFLIESVVFPCGASSFDLVFKSQMFFRHVQPSTESRYQTLRCGDAPNSCVRGSGSESPSLEFNGGSKKANCEHTPYSKTACF